MNALFKFNLDFATLLQSVDTKSVGLVLKKVT